MTTVENDASRVELLEFVESLRYECGNKSLYEAWQICGGINKWYTKILATSHETLAKKYLSFAQVMQFVGGDFYNKILSRAICKSLELDTLDALMRVSLCKIEMENMDWKA